MWDALQSKPDQHHLKFGFCRHPNVQPFVHSLVSNDREWKSNLLNFPIPLFPDSSVRLTALWCRARIDCFPLLILLLLVFRNFHLQMSGLVILAVAVWTVFWKHQYVSLLSTTNYAIGTYSLLAAGLLALLGGFIGCCGVWREQRPMLLLVRNIGKEKILLKTSGFAYNSLRMFSLNKIT